MNELIDYCCSVCSFECTFPGPKHAWTCPFCGTRHVVSAWTEEEWAVVIAYADEHASEFDGGDAATSATPTPDLAAFIFNTLTAANRAAAELVRRNPPTP